MQTIGELYMKKQIVCLIAALFLFGCATVEKYEPIPPIEDHPYRHVDIHMKGLPKITVIIPDYAVDYIHDRDRSYVVHLSKNIIMMYFTKAGPNLKNPGHAVAIIFDASKGYIPLLFQTTIQEEQRFFSYVHEYDMRDDWYNPLDEITKPIYRDILKLIIDMDKKEEI